jgi:oxygen-dependent protoporphyrinogen oxidase
MLAQRRRTASRRPGEAGLFTTLRGGMQQLADALKGQLSPSSVQLGTAVQSMRQQNQGWLITTGSGSARFDGVILAVPGHAVAPLLLPTSAALAEEFDRLRFASSVTVALGYGSRIRAALPSGFGFLVPRSEGKRILAATFVHNKFAHRSPADRALIRCFLGGTRDEAVLGLAPDEILRTVGAELLDILGISEAPMFARVYKWERSVVQYDVGYLEKLERIARLSEPYPSLALAGNAFCGIGIPDCIRSGQQAVARLMENTGLIAKPERGEKALPNGNR